MQTWNLDDKSEWGPGPWQDEPDKAVWVDEATGLDCMIHRSRGGALCGYVGVADHHPAFGKHYSDVDVVVHGGLTYADKCNEDDPEGICHVPAPGRPHDVWWFGFDCAHGRDVLPQMNDTVGLRRYQTYRDFGYVKKEVESLAQQLLAIQT